ncbi:MAG: amidohydrolase family protein [Sedimentisphaerales bacterium]
MCANNQTEGFKVNSLAAIDVHGHIGTYARGCSALADKLMSGSVPTLIKNAELANTAITIVSSMKAFHPPGQSNSIMANTETANIVQADSRLMQWAVIDPHIPYTFNQAADLLTKPWCAGIKIHPEMHMYPINEHGKTLFEFAAEHNAIILTHSGEQSSQPKDFVEFADTFPQVTLILAHLGFGWDGDPSHHVRAVQASKHGNVFVDTSSSLSIMTNLLEWAVSEIGAERILYGTDSPLYFAPMQRARINYADISNEAKKKILADNAIRLFKLSNLIKTN